MRKYLLAIVLAFSIQPALAEVKTDDFSTLINDGLFKAEDFYFTASSPQNLEYGNGSGIGFRGLMVFNFFFYREPISVSFDTETFDAITDGPDFMPRSSSVSFNFNPGDPGDYWVEAGFFPASSSDCDIQGCSREELLQLSHTTINSITYELKNTAPIPEPETYAMMLSGLSLIGLVARRQRKMSGAAAPQL